MVKEIIVRTICPFFADTIHLCALSLILSSDEIYPAELQEKEIQPLPDGIHRGRTVFS
jgi:hypothetical protein